MASVDFPAIRAQYPLLEVARKYVDLKASGNEWKGLCPFHEDHNPSFHIYPAPDGNWRYVCFACGAGMGGGDVLDFVRGMHSTDVSGALKILSNGGGHANPERYQPKPSEADLWRPIVPVPDDAPEYNPAQTYNTTRGLMVEHKPTRLDTYRDADGRVLLHVTRLEFEKDGRRNKACITVTWCEGPDGRQLWATQRPDRPYPLMGLDGLAKYPNRHVLVVSGEKCVEAAQKNLAGFVVVTNLGGDAAVAHTDWSPLMGRHVVFMPDADKSGIEAMAAIPELIGAKCASIRHIKTKGLAVGFDIADLVDSGVTGPALVEWLKHRAKDGPVLASVPSEPVEAAKPASKAATTPAPPSNVVPIRKQDDDALFLPEYTELRLADDLARECQGKLCYVPEWKTFMSWVDGHWCDETLHPFTDRVQDFLAGKSRIVAQDFDLGRKAASISERLARQSTVRAVESIIRGRSEFRRPPSMFDSEPLVLNTPDGMVDLETGKLRKAEPADYATLSARVSPGGECPTWKRVLDDCTDGDEDLQAYLQRLAGYCLTASVSEQKYFFAYGTGRNGKGTFINTLSWLLGGYAKVSEPETFMASSRSRHADEIAYLQGARLVTAQEIQQGSRWNEPRIKAMTGGDPITANRMYGAKFTFFPTMKIIFSGNDKPELRSVDPAMVARLQLIPFTVTIPPDKRDGDLPSKLRSEGPGILQWAIDGCLQWQKHGLAMPSAVKDATQEYFQQQDTMSEFISDCLDVGPGYEALTSELYKRFKEWCKDSGEYCPTRRRFVDVLPKYGLSSQKLGGVMKVMGVQLKFIRPVDSNWHQ